MNLNRGLLNLADGFGQRGIRQLNVFVLLKFLAIYRAVYRDLSNSFGCSAFRIQDRATNTQTTFCYDFADEFVVRNCQDNSNEMLR